MRHGPVATTNNTAFAFLLEASHRQGFTVAWANYRLPEGVFVTTINGASNGEGGRSWHYLVNDLCGDRAADKKEIGDGDVVLWTFELHRGCG